MTIQIYTDGGARGNPGPAAIGVVVLHDNKPVAEWGKGIGAASNNVAEYWAVSDALEYVHTYVKGISKKVKKTIEHIHFYLDSTLVVNQLNGTFKVKDANLREFLMKIRILEREVGIPISYTYIPREKNTRADFMVNRALDNLQ